MTVPCCRKEAGCDGVLDEKKGFRLQTGCHSFTVAYPCTVCGRVSTIQSAEGEKYAVGMNRRSGEEVYFQNDELIYKLPYVEVDGYRQVTVKSVSSCNNSTQSTFQETAVTVQCPPKFLAEKLGDIEVHEGDVLLIQGQEGNSDDDLFTGGRLKDLKRK